MRSEIAFDELSLKKYESNDAQELFMLTGKNRDYLRKTLNWLDNVKSVDDSLSFISNCIEKDLLGYFIYYRKSMIGIVGLVESDTTNNNAEIGYFGLIKICKAAVLLHGLCKPFYLNYLVRKTSKLL